MLEHLRHIRAVVVETREDVKRVILRTGLIEQSFATSQVSKAGQNLEIDRIRQR